jgi:hypothetical protein
MPAGQQRESEALQPEYLPLRMRPGAAMPAGAGLVPRDMFVRLQLPGQVLSERLLH